MSLKEAGNNWGVVEQLPYTNTPRQEIIKNRLIPLALDIIRISRDAQVTPEGDDARMTFESSGIVLIDRGEGFEYIRISPVGEYRASRVDPGKKLVGIRIDKSDDKASLEKIDESRKAFLYFAQDRGGRGQELFSENRLKVDDESLERVGMYLEAIKRAFERGDLVVNRENSPELFTQEELHRQE
jgi:hypothetical protein